MAAVALIVTFLASTVGVADPVPGMKGLGFLSPNHWIESAGLSMNIALGVSLLSAVAMIVISRIYNLHHTLSLVCGAFFLWMLAACPMSAGHFNGGLLLVAVMLAAWNLLFSTFDTPAATPRVFLAFFLVAAGALTQYGFIPYLPILLVGCGQLRIFNFRTLMVAMTAIITPVWITWGLGLIDFTAVSKPTFDSIFTEFAPRRLVWYLSLTGFTLALLVTLVMANVIRIYSYNLATRARNSLVIATSIATAVLTVVDFTNMPFYFPLLCCCTAFQLGHYTHFHSGHRVCNFMLLGVMLVYMGFYIWRMLI